MAFINKNQEQNLKEVFSNKGYMLFGFISMAAIGYLFYYFTPFDVLAGNLGKTYAWLTVATESLIAVLFGINLPLATYKLRLFSSIGSKEGGASLFGSAIGVLAAGCPACGVTLASVLGIGSIFTVLPYYGLELKFIGLGFLIYSTYSLSNDLKTCDSGIRIKKDKNSGTPKAVR